MGETPMQEAEGNPVAAAPEPGGGDGGGGGGVRSCEVERPDNGVTCGFHLSRTQWDPYPWVSGVDAGSAAEAAGLLAGDCVLEVNGEDVLGERIGAVATRVRARPNKVSLLLWNAGSHPQCNTESLCCGPMPVTLQRLSACVAAVVAALECPVCLEPVAPPAHQCYNGHLICVRCRVRSERCPVCRVRFCRGRSLLADRCFHALADAFNLKAEAEETRPAKLREKIFGHRKKALSAGKSPAATPPTNKFLARLMGKASSVENLSFGGSGGRHYSPDAEFTSLKAKSLSTSEIFRPLSPAPSRCPSALALHGPAALRSSPAARPASRPASYHGSSESLSCRIASDFGDRLEPVVEDGSLYHCPADADCPSLLKASAVLQHVQEHHDGPLVNYFQPRVLWSLPPPLERSAVVAINTEGATFFAVVERFSEEADAEGGGWRMWLWLVGSKRDVRAWTASATVRAGPRERTLPLPVLPLATAAWSDVRKGRQALELSTEALRRDFPAEANAGCPLGLLLQVQPSTCEDK